MTPQQREKAMIMHSAIKAKIDKNEPLCVLNSWVQPCGTYGCVGGDTFIAMNSDFVGDIDAIAYGSESLAFNFEDTFGFSGRFEVDGRTFHVFGARDSGTLQQRLDYVESQLDLNKHGS